MDKSATALFDVVVLCLRTLFPRPDSPSSVFHVRLSPMKKLANRSCSGIGGSKTMTAAAETSGIAPDQHKTLSRTFLALA